MSDSLVLVVDDSSDDLALAAIAARHLKIDLRTVNSGEEAIRYLSGEGIYADRLQHPLPRLVLLDLKMPRVSGFDVLEAVQRLNFGLKVPIVVMSSSSLQIDIERATALGAFAYHTKPGDITDLSRLMQRLCQFFRLQYTPSAVLRA